MSTTTYLITGSSRSLGLGYAHELLKSSSSARVIAAVRNPSKSDQLEPLVKEFGKERVYVLECDVNEAESTQVSLSILNLRKDFERELIDCLGGVNRKRQRV